MLFVMVKSLYVSRYIVSNGEFKKEIKCVFLARTTITLFTSEPNVNISVRSNESWVTGAFLRRRAW